MNIPPPTEKQAQLIWLAVTGLAIAVLAGLVVVVIWGLGQVLHILSPVLWPLAIAGVVAYLLDPVVDRLEKRGLSRAKAIITVFVAALLILAAVFGSVIPQIVNETRGLAQRIPEMTSNVQARIENWIDNPPAFLRKLLKRDQASQGQSAADGSTNQVSSGFTNDFSSTTVTPTNAPALFGDGFDKDTLQSATSWVAQAIPKFGKWLSGQAGRVASWFGVLAGLALVPVYAFYLLLEREGIRSKWTDYLPVADSKFKEEVVFVLRSINDYLIAFFRGQVLVAICDSVLYTIGFLCIGLPYAVLLGFLAIFLTLIPFLGAIALCAGALIIAVVQYGDWTHPLMVMCVFAVVQALEGLVISPKIMGDRVGLHPLTIIIAVMAGTTLLGGVLGGILAIPLTAVLRVLMGRYVWKRRHT